MYRSSIRLHKQVGQLAETVVCLSMSVFHRISPICSCVDNDAENIKKYNRPSFFTNKTHRVMSVTLTRVLGPMRTDGNYVYCLEIFSISIRPPSFLCPRLEQCRQDFGKAV